MKKQMIPILTLSGFIVLSPVGSFATSTAVSHVTVKSTASIVAMDNSEASISAASSSSAFNSGTNKEFDEKITITIDEEQLETKVDPVIVDGTTFIAAGDLQALSGCQITWSDARKELTVRYEQTVIVLKIGSKSALINNKLEALSEAPFIVNGNAMLPVKHVSNAMGFDVSWNGMTKEISVTSPKKAQVSTAPAVALLAYDQAIQNGIKKSPDYQSSLLSKDRVKSQDDDLFLSPGTYNLQLLKAKQDLKLYNNWADKQIPIVMEQIGNSVKNQMDDLSLLFVEKKNQQYKIELIAEKLRVEKISYDYGMSSFQSLMDSQTNHQKEVQNLMIIEQKINAAYTKLNQTLGNPADYRNSLEYDIQYAPIGDVNLDYKIIDDTASDPFIWYASQNVDSKEFKLNLYEYNAGGQSWTLTALDLTEARKNLSDTKTALAGVIRDRYNSLIQLEEQIRLLELTLEQAKDSVNSIRLQYDLGNVIKLQVEEAQMAIPGIEYQIQSLKQQHEQLKMLFEKPYLAPTYVSGGV